MSDEQALYRACLAAPDDYHVRLVYADWLDEHDDPRRAEFLRVAVSRRDIPKDAPDKEARHKANRERLTALRRDIDPRWAATFDEFDCLIHDSRTARVRITTYGSPPKKYGRGAVKISFGFGADEYVLLHAGWEWLGRGRDYHYFRLPRGQRGRNVVLPVQVPTDDEILRLGTEWHRGGRARRRMAGPWLVQYKPRRLERSRSGRTFSDGVWGPEPPEREMPPEFNFGVLSPWYATLLWSDGDDRPPRVSRSTREVPD